MIETANNGCEIEEFHDSRRSWFGPYRRLSNTDDKTYTEVESFI